ncbi:MAG: hypothetical protein II839_11025 [Kiritimatiellae bacterium]|nr:hypothetical protein [Kiritimatiellia bacterium]
MFRPFPFRPSAVLLAAALLAGGCASPTTGRVRDAHLLWSGSPEERRIVRYEQAGPFWERVETADGAVRTSWRPFLYTDIVSADPSVSHDEILWPVWSRNRRGDEVSWRFLVFFGMDKDVGDAVSPQDRTWLFPFWFSGTSKKGDPYAALFPIHGSIREMYWEKIGFTLFPLWVTWDRNGNHTWSVLWPFIQHQTGPGRDAWRIIPFWGRTRVEGKQYSRFVMWPIWTESEYYDVNPGTEWMLWPLLGHVDRANEEAWLALPPLFHFAKGRGKTPEYRKMNFPWPLVMINDDKDSHRRWFFPFWMHRWSTDGKIDSLTVLWPFWHELDIRMGRRTLSENTLFPVWHHSRLEAAATNGLPAALEEDYQRIWPLWSRRYDEENRFVRIPDLTFRKRAGQLERNLLGMFTLYTRGETAHPRRVDHEALWGAIRRGYGDEYSATRIWPFYDSKEEKDVWHWSILWGLIGRSGRAGESAWQWLWFFGDRLDTRSPEGEESHAESAEGTEKESHAESAEDVEKESHAESAEGAEKESDAESAEGAEKESHAESAEDVEKKFHAESAEGAEKESNAESAEGTEKKSHAESAEGTEKESHAESAEDVEKKSHAESAEGAE